jgi:Protein of unknown function (DUF4235)
MARVLFAPVSIVAGLIAGLMGRKLFDGAWGLIDDQEAPDAEHREIEWPKLVAALLVEGAIFRLIKGLVDHGSRRFFERATGVWPGEEAPEPE